MSHTRTHFEDFAVGDRVDLGSREVTEGDIVAFAHEFDPQPMHLDDDDGRKTLLEGLGASGWHTCGVMMRLLADNLLVGSTCMGSPGVQDNRWLRPVRAGDHLSAALDIVGVTAPASRPDRGFVAVEATLRNQGGETVMTQRSALMFARREPGPPPPPKAPAKSAPPEQSPPDADDAAHFAGARYFDDVAIGARLVLGSYRFERATMLRFAERFDPQAFHLSDEAAAQSHFGRLSASGWHTAAAWMRTAMMARQKADADGAPRIVGPSPGFRDLRWIRPVLVDDTLTYTAAATEKRPVSRPGWGLVTSHNEGWNQNGNKVFEFTGLALYPLRP